MQIIADAAPHWTIKIASAFIDRARLTRRLNLGAAGSLMSCEQASILPAKAPTSEINR